MADIFFSILAAFIFTIVLVVLIGWRHPRRPGTGFSILFAFIILFLISYGIGIWLTPYGPQVWGSYYLGFFWIALLVMLFIATVSGFTRNSVPENEKMGWFATFGIFFWLLLIVMIVLVGYRYFAPVVI